MNGQQQQQQQRPPHDPTRSSPRRVKIASSTATASGNAAGEGVDPSLPPQQGPAVTRQLYAPPVGGVVPHGFVQPNTASMSAVPNPLAPPGPMSTGAPPLRNPPLPSSSVINNNNKRPHPGPSPPITMPPIPEHDPKEMEERRRKALAYAMSDDITGGAKGRKRHAAKLAAEKKKAAIASKVKGAQYRVNYNQMPPGSRVNYMNATEGTTSIASLPRSNATSSAIPSAVANPLAPFGPKPPPPNLTNTAISSTSAQYLPMQQAGLPRKQQIMFNPKVTLEPPKRGRPRKDDSKATPVNSGIGAGLHVGFSDSKNLSISLLAEAASNSPSAAVPNDAFAPLPLRRLYDDESMYDPEYARFMRSIMGDDQSILTFRTLQSIRSVGGGVEGPPLGTIVGDGSMTFGTVDDDDASYQLTSDEDDDDDDDVDVIDDDDDDDDNDNMEEDERDEDQKNEMKVDSPAKGTRSKRKALQAFPPGSPPGLKTLSVDKDDLGIFHDEIEGLMEEDLEAAVASLIGVSPEGEFSSSSWQTGTAPPTGKNAAMAGTEQAQAITTPGQSTRKKKSTATIVTSPTPVMPSTASESNHATSANPRTTREPPVVSQEQLRRLRAAMARHHQLLLQQATLAVRAAYVQKMGGKAGKTSGQNRAAGSIPESSLTANQSACSYQNDFFAGETPEELSDCLDSSVSMLQDLEQHWKDAVRNSIQLAFKESHGQMARRRLLQSCGVTRASSLPQDIGEGDTGGNSNQSDENKRLTRSAFTRTLIERELEAEPMSGHFKPPTRQRVSVFEVRGLARLRETFTAIDNSVKDIYIARDKKRIKDGVNILAPQSHKQACNILLNHAKADVDPDYVPGQLELYNILTHAPEAFSNESKGHDPSKVKCPLTKIQKLELRKNRNQYTAAEDNLILRGVNLYGEKEWVLVSDRFLPDRQVNHIAQRYNRLTFLIYKANGVSIGDKGELPPMPKIGKNGTYDEEKANEIKPAEAPTTMNVHRWTLEEDLAILKAVPVFGSCWADISSKLMPHRDRGHIRKRYQVLERRMPKGVCKVNLKRMFADRSPPAKPPKKAKTRSPTSRGSPNKPSPTKSVALNELNVPSFQSSTARPSIETPMSPIKSSMQSSGPFSHGRHGFGNGTECYSPETKGAAALLGVFSGFSQESQHGEDTRMGVLKILEIADGRMADSNFGEGNFGKGGAPRSPMKSSSDLLDDITPKGGRTSILNSVLDNVRRKDDKNDLLPTTPSKVDFNSYLATTTTLSHAVAPPDEASPTMSFNLGTPAKDEAKSQYSMDGEEFARLFMSDKSRQTPLKTGLESPVKTTAMGSNFSPIKFGNIAPHTPITHLGSLGMSSGPVDGMNSLFMGAYDLDAVAALKDLSNSNPGTPANLTAPPPAAAAAAAAAGDEDLNERKCKRPKTSFFGQVQANVGRRKSG